ncbi:MAG: dihydroneopterin aldolase [Deltaproteobacteria bacterium]|jgi:dihydroneopterin aldolase|nr:MAG: dihydroneopterin aldolase [Deltaproteobacteria bacterium]HJL95326.1 dihydroneopterin aldolase [SAR324 cluster bacterium]
MSGKQNFTIILKNIIVYGFHGVHQEEKTLGQRFEIDLEYRLANPPFPWKDEERATVSYVNAHKIVSRVCAEKSFNLIETLGNRIIEEMRSRYSIDLIIVRVRKPSVPIQGILDFVEVEVEWQA